MATKKDQVQVFDLCIEEAFITIKGNSPLLTNAWSDQAIDDIERCGTPGAAKEPRKARTIEEKFADAHYLTPGNKPGIPASAIKAAIVSAGFRFAKEKSTVLKGLFSIVGDDVLEIQGSKPKMRRDVVKPPGAMGGTSIAYRPMWEDWSITFRVKYLSNLITLEKLILLINTAGVTVGIGAWRPEKDGTFGTFEVQGLGTAQ